MKQSNSVDRFIDFFLVEQKLKWKVYATAIAAASAWAFIRFLLSPASEERITWEAIIILCLTVFAAVGVYASRGSIFSATSMGSFSFPRLTRFNLAAAVASILLMITVSMVNVPKMQAMIVNAKLANLSKFLDSAPAAFLPENQLQKRYKKIQSILSVSSASRLPIDPNILQNTESAVAQSLRRGSYSEQTKQLGWATSIDLRSLAYARRVQEGVITPPPIAIDPSIHGPVQITDKHGLTITSAGRSLLYPGERFVIAHSSVSFIRIDFQDISAGSAIELADDASSVTVSDSIMTFVIQNLDRITWIDVHFENSQLSYTEGARLSLRNVTFQDCDLSHLGTGPVAMQLQKLIEAAGGKPVTFTYDPQSQP